MTNKNEPVLIGEDEPQYDETTVHFKHLTRQLDIIPIDKLAVPITLFGAGAIGSFTALGLAKSGFTNLTVFDDDAVSIENMSCSLFRRKDVNFDKVVALANIIKEFCECDITTHTRRFAPVDEKTGHVKFEQAPQGISIICVDSMKARHAIWMAFQQNVHPNAWLIDSRMSAEEGLIFAIKPSVKFDRETYEATLYSDDEAVKERCTEKSTTYTALLLSGQIINTIKAIVTEKPDEYPRVQQWSIKHSDLVVHKVRHNAVNG